MRSKIVLFASSLFTELASMDWKEEHDVQLCCEILISQTYKFKERMVYVKFWLRF